MKDGIIESNNDYGNGKCNDVSINKIRVESCKKVGNGDKSKRTISDVSTDEDITCIGENNKLAKKSKIKIVKKKSVPTIDHLFTKEESTGLFICKKCPPDDERRHPPLQTSMRKHLWHAHKLGKYL